jgi:hypothetical protein
MKKEAKIDYDQLPETVEISGVGIPNLTAKCLARTKTKAIYYRWDNVYEVFRIKVAEPTEVFGKKYDKREVYPSSEDFGKLAWCFSDEKLARDMYERI